MLLHACQGLAQLLRHVVGGMMSPGAPLSSPELACRADQLSTCEQVLNLGHYYMCCEPACIFVDLAAEVCSLHSNTRDTRLHLTRLPSIRAWGRPSPS